MSNPNFTVEDFVNWSEKHADELTSTGQTTLAMKDYGSRRTCKHLIHDLTSRAGVSQKDYEISFDEKTQEFILELKTTPAVAVEE